MWCVNKMLPHKRFTVLQFSSSILGLGDVLRPILNKYNYELDFVKTFVKDNTDPLDMGLSVTYVDGQRLSIVCRDDEGKQKVILQFIIFVLNFNWFSDLPTEFVRPPFLPIISNTKGFQQNNLDEITNKVFNELLEGKADSNSGAQGGTNLTSKGSDQGSLKV